MTNGNAACGPLPLGVVRIGDLRREQAPALHLICKHCVGRGLGPAVNGNAFDILCRGQFYIGPNHRPYARFDAFVGAGVPDRPKITAAQGEIRYAEGCFTVARSATIKV